MSGAAAPRELEAREKSRIFETVQAIGGMEWRKTIGMLLCDLAQLPPDITGPDGQPTDEEIYVWDTGFDCKGLRCCCVRRVLIIAECLEDLVRFLRHDTPSVKPVRCVLL